MLGEHAALERLLSRASSHLTPAASQFATTAVATRDYRFGRIQILEISSMNLNSVGMAVA
jgi:hypothetical protein